MIGHYEPSASAVLRVRDARPLYVEGRHVTAEVEQINGHMWLTIFVGGSIVLSRRMPQEITHASQVNPWVRDYVLTETGSESTRPSDANVKLAQQVWDAHHAIACSEDCSVSVCWSPVYQASQKLLLATLRTVYGLSSLKAWRVYDVLIDSGDPVAWAVEYVRDNRRSSVYSR